MLRAKRGERITTRAQRDIWKLRDQALHDAVFFTQMLASILPIVGNGYAVDTIFNIQLLLNFAIYLIAT